MMTFLIAGLRYELLMMTPIVVCAPRDKKVGKWVSGRRRKFIKYLSVKGHHEQYKFDEACIIIFLSEKDRTHPQPPSRTLPAFVMEDHTF